MAKEEKRLRQALDGTRLNAFGMDPNDLIVIGYDTDDGPEHPLFDERAKLPLSEEMINSLMLQGVLEVVLVRKNGDKAEVVAGRQRVKNAREANKRLKKQGAELIHVPCMVRKGDDGMVMGVSISENEIREDDPLTVKASKLARYLGLGKSEQEAATVFGVSLQTIKNWGRLGDLDNSVIKAIEAGKIKPSAAWNLSDLSREDQKVELEKLLANGHTTVRKAGHAVKNAKAKKGGAAEGLEAPGKRLVAKVLKLDRKAGVLSEDFARGVAWMLGELSPTSVKGLTALISEARGEKKGE